MLTILENSLCYRFFNKLIKNTQVAYDHSASGRFFARLTKTLNVWLAESILVRFFWVNDSFSLWQKSLTYRFVSKVTALVKNLLKSVSCIIGRGRETSLFFSLFAFYSSVLKSSPVIIFLDMTFVFLTANLVIRLALRAYSPISLLVFAAGAAAALFFRIYLEETQTAFKESYVVGMVKSTAAWLLAFPQEAKNDI